VSEYCLLKLKQDKFIFYDIEWLYDQFNAEDEEKSSVCKNMRKVFHSFEDFLHSLLSQENTDFIYELTQPLLDENTISNQDEIELSSFIEGIYIELHEKLGAILLESCIDIPHSSFNLVGFFSTTAIIALDETPPIRYPSWKELYGSVGAKDFRSKVSDNSLLQTLDIYVSDRYSSNPNTISDEQFVHTRVEEDPAIFINTDVPF